LNANGRPVRAPVLVLLDWPSGAVEQTDFDLQARRAARLTPDMG
jgi:hypothetical protein